MANPPALHERFPDNLRRLREQRSLSQEQLAALASMSRPAITRYEQGKRYARLSHMVLLADALGVTVDELVRGEVARAS